MTKEAIVKAIIDYIEEVSKEENLEITDLGTGNAFKGSFWEGVIQDNSEIPNIIAKKDKYSIELRSFWGHPELDIRDNHELIVINYSDCIWEGNQLVHKGDFRLNEVRVDGGNCKENLNKAFKIIDKLESTNND